MKPTQARRSVLVVLLVMSLAGVGCGGLPHLSRDASPKQLRVSNVVLYQNGVGYFERRGTLKGRKIELRVRPDQINDVLKSLSVLKRNGGRVSSVTLPVERSSDRLAAELPAQVRRARGLVGLLQVLRGVKVSIETAEQDYRGRVVGVEGGGKGARLTLLQGKKKLVAMRVQRIAKVRIHDRALASGLARSLDISKNDGRWKPVGVTLRFADAGPHDLLISYILEVPVWRPAYRAWVEKGKGVRLSGWAVVDNVSGEDWRDIALSLVVGAPLSFRYNLHRPHHVTRPDLSSRLAATAAAPPPPDVGYATRAGGGRAPRTAKKMGRSYGRRRRPARPRAKPARSRQFEADSAAMAGAGVGAGRSSGGSGLRWSNAERRRAMRSSAAALVAGRKVGALYRYDALQPVTVPDGRAALIPIVDRTVPGEDVFLFRNLSASAPYRAVLLRNGAVSSVTDGAHTSAHRRGGDLESGPITLYVGGTFAGEGFLGRIERGAVAFVPYAQESGLKVSRSMRGRTEDTRLIKAVAGRITVQGKRSRLRTLTIRSEREEPGVVYVKLRKSPGFSIEKPPKGLIRAGTDLYLRIAVPAKGVGKATLIESSPIRRTSVYLSDLVISAFRLYLSDAQGLEAVKGPIRAMLAAREQLSTLISRRQHLQRQRNVLRIDARRIRRNLDSLPMGRVAAKLRRQLVGQLEDNSQKAAQTAKKLVEVEVERATLQQRINTLLKQITLR